jgi:hypothetical protein
MEIRGQVIDVDVKAELKEFEWENAKWTQNKLIAKSPFRDDSHPSFFCRLVTEGKYQAGLWGDSGSDGSNEKGNLLALLAFLRNETREETEEYLLEKYGGDVGYRALKLTFDLFQEKRYGVSERLLEGWSLGSPYLESRGIKPHLIEKLGIKEKNGVVAIPWRDTNGKLANIKYRMTGSKKFWYQEDGVPIADLVWGLRLIQLKNVDYAVITEAEIDSLTLLSAGIPSIAIGGSAFTKTKQDLLRKSGIKRLYIGTDRDKIGWKLKKEMGSKLGNFMDLYEIEIPHPYKDINDVREPRRLLELIRFAKKKETFYKNFG